MVEMFSSAALSAEMVESLGEHPAILLRGNGQVTVGRTIAEAVMMAIYLEEAAAILYGALQIGTPNILSMAALDGSLRVFHEAGLDRLREKSMALTEFLMDLADARLAAHGFAIATPREKHRRGGHVALAHLEAARICKALRQSGVVPDFRPPNIVRLAPVALYSTFAGCVAAVDAIEHIMQSKSYQSVDLTRELVT